MLIISNKDKLLMKWGISQSVRARLGKFPNGESGITRKFYNEWHYGTRSSVTFDLGGQQPQPLNFNPSSDRTIMESVGPSISSDTEVVLFY